MILWRIHRWHEVWWHPPPSPLTLPKETLENQAHPRENTRVSAGADWAHGRQAAWIWRLQTVHRQEAHQAGAIPGRDGEGCSTTIWLRGRADLVDRSRGDLLNPVAMRRAPGRACSPHRSTDCALHVQTTSRQPPGGGCRSGWHLGEQCPPD